MENLKSNEYNLALSCTLRVFNRFYNSNKTCSFIRKIKISLNKKKIKLFKIET